MILPLLFVLQVATADSLIRAEYDHTKYGRKTIVLMERQAISYDYLDIMLNAAAAETSMGLQMIGDDGKSVGLFQDKITVSLDRHHPLGWNELDSLAMRFKLLQDHVFNMSEYQWTLYEMLRHHINCGRTGNQAMRAAVRSTNRGKKRVRYMDRAGDEYLKKVVK